MRRLIRWFIIVVVVPITSYFVLAVFLGLIPVHIGATQARDGIPVFVVSNGVHTDLLLPMISAQRDWRTFLPTLAGVAATPQTAYVAFGWGDREFYLNTPTWDDLKATTALYALTGLDRTVLHVMASAAPPRSDQVRKLLLRPEQLLRLTEYIDGSFARDASNRPTQIPGAHYGSTDAFYEATGRYWFGFTCNEWARKGLDRAGVRMPAWSPFDTAIFLQIPDPPLN